MIDLTTIEVFIGIGIIGIIFTLCILVLWNYVYTNGRREKLFEKELIEISIRNAKLKDLLDRKDREIEKLRGEEKCQ